eukprot:g9668.t1
MSIKFLHDAVGALKLPPLVNWLHVLPQYRDGNTVFRRKNANTPNRVALTIDDGLWCGNRNRDRTSAGDHDASLVDAVLDLLREYNVRATFFLIADHLNYPGVEEHMQRLIQDGHEIANHGLADRPMSWMSGEEFEAALLEGSRVLQGFLDRAAGAAGAAEKGEPNEPRPPTSRQASVTLFRSPSAMYNFTMSRVLKRHSMQHVLGDAYCDDFQVKEPSWIAETMFRQTKDGSILITHMPDREKGREHLLEALELLLRKLVGAKPEDRAGSTTSSSRWAGSGFKVGTVSELLGVAGVGGVCGSGSAEAETANSQQ